VAPPPAAKLFREEQICLYQPKSENSAEKAQNNDNKVLFIRHRQNLYPTSHLEEVL
jgi:hypothetical protein